ncbi:Cyclic nucleotide-binding protein [Pseudocohnilembus persalinus]|uniref:Cyclic nucleotide-binding protein n=1 Tax=Pseudocohnilembus persalinus TaxID=266149 RepID=A0A0V0QXN0_PSEPJ|nr:Cyclic nucleotide-binding protein [Pseudocohnilembus persalinus]|eukprot:KRX07129.1 Cyclic nucleotide-binding protein [Pseudocohnilembus persalinus]
MEALENLKKQDYMGNQLNQSLGDGKINKLKATQIYNESEKKMQNNLNFSSQNHINMTQKHVKRLQSANRNKKNGIHDYINSNNITYTNDEYHKNDSSHYNLDSTNQINDVSTKKNLNKCISNIKMKLQKNYSRNNQNELYTGCNENKNKQTNAIPKRSTSHNIIKSKVGVVSKNVQQNNSQKQNNQQYAPVFDTNNYNYKFPDWLNKRVDFQNLQTLEHFDMNKKILSVAKTPSSDRMPPEIQLVALFLKKLSLFRLMPQYLLEFIAGKIYTQSFINQQTQQKEFRSYNHGEYICRQGDQGNSMFIIFRGQVEVLIGGNVVETFQLKELIGRTALENEVPRTADLRAKGNVDLLILNRQDYQHCIFQFVKQERENLGEFIRSIPFINKSFNEQKIKKLTRDVKIKFFAPKDKLYMEGHQIDGVYIIKEGSFIQNIQVKLDYQNQWPLKVQDKKTWEKRITSKVVDYNIKYTAQQILGFSEIIDPPNNGVRKETISAVEDTIAIFIPKSQFTTNYLKQMNPQTKESLIMKVKNDENNMKQRIQQIERALKQNLKTYNHEQIQVKQRKMDGIIQNTNKKLKDDMKKQLPYRLSKVIKQIKK